MSTPVEALDTTADVGVSHIVLLGDSTLDNGRYLDLSQGELSVEKLLQRKCVERGWNMTVLAQDGSMLDDVKCRQLPLIPDRSTHVVISATGNDLLNLLNELVVANFSMSSMYSVIGSKLAELSEAYREMILSLKMLGVHVCVCTIQHPHFNHIFFKGIATFGLGLHNGRIRQLAEEIDVSVIDLANILDSPEDFSNPLEMSTRGGSKLMANIDEFVRDHPVSLLLRHVPGGYEDGDHLFPDGLTVTCQPRMCCKPRGHQRRMYAGKIVPQIIEPIYTTSHASLEVPASPRTKDIILSSSMTTTVPIQQVLAQEISSSTTQELPSPPRSTQELPIQQRPPVEARGRNAAAGAAGAREITDSPVPIQRTPCELDI